MNLFIENIFLEFYHFTNDELKEFRFPPLVLNHNRF